MKVTLVLQPEDDIIGAFDMDALPRVGDDVAIQTQMNGYQCGYRVRSVSWIFDTWLVSSVTTQVDIEKKEQRL